MRFIKVLFFAVFCAICNCAALEAQDKIDELKKAIDEIKNKQNEIDKNINDIKMLLIKNAFNNKIPINNEASNNIEGKILPISKIPVLGNKNANVIMIEVSDYECPYCAKYHKETFEQIKNNYINNGTIKYAVMDFPLPMHKMALKAAQASYCANDQGKYWEMRKNMMEKQQDINDLSKLAKETGMNIKEYDKCMNAETYKTQIEKEMDAIAKLNINGVPAFIFAKQEKEGEIKAISMIMGARTYQEYKEKLDKILKEYSR